MFLDHIILKPGKITFPKFDFAIMPSDVMESSLQNPVLHLLIIQQLVYWKPMGRISFRPKYPEKYLIPLWK